MRVEQEKVELFMQRCGQPTPEKPELGEPARAQFRYDLMHEELNEYAAAVASGDLVAIADAIADLAYTVLGTSVHHGMDLQPLFNEVHRSNLTKDVDLTTIKKAVKGPTYEPPRIAEVLFIQATGLQGVGE